MTHDYNDYNLKKLKEYKTLTIQLKYSSYALNIMYTIAMYFLLLFVNELAVFNIMKYLL